MARVKKQFTYEEATVEFCRTLKYGFCNHPYIADFLLTMKTFVGRQFTLKDIIEACATRNIHEEEVRKLFKDYSVKMRQLQQLEKDGATYRLI